MAGWIIWRTEMILIPVWAVRYRPYVVNVVLANGSGYLIQGNGIHRIYIPMQRAARMELLNNPIHEWVDNLEW